MSFQNVSLKCRNFKCFADPPQGFDEIKPINIIIGRNNSGKSTLLDLVEHATEPSDISGRGHRGGAPQVVFSLEISPQIADALPVERSVYSTSSGTEFFVPAGMARQYLVGNRIQWEVGTSGNKGGAFHDVIGLAPAFVAAHKPELVVIAKMIRRVAPNQFRISNCCRVLADRDITPEASNTQLNVKPNGSGVTNVVQRYLTSDSLDRDLVEKVFLRELNAILQPDADFTRISIAEKQSKEWEIYLEESSKGRIPLSLTGSGLKTVLLVLANLLLVPTIGTNSRPIEEPTPLSNFLFCFEELENNLHPAIQRRLFRYLREKAVNDGCHFFITTHSNVVIDMFSGDEHAQLLHVTHDGESASVTVVETSRDGHSVLTDLDFRASDLLQTNVVVWVEGPSDRLYFNRWVELWADGELVEGIHYQCLPFGGSLNAHLSFDAPERVDELVAALKINSHAILLIDRDKRSEDADLKPHTKRLVDEVNEQGGYAWVTAGKEVENYIPVTILQKLLSNENLRGPGQYKDALDFIAKKKGSETKPGKVSLARDIAPLLDKTAIAATLDLPEKLDEVSRRIRDWNRVEEGPGK